MAYQEATATRSSFFFLSHSREMLQNATPGLDGKFALKRAQFPGNFLSSNRGLTRWAKRDLFALYQLLTRRSARPVDRIETVMFAEVDQADLVVDDVYLPTNELLVQKRAAAGEDANAVFDIDLAA